MNRRLATAMLSAVATSICAAALTVAAPAAAQTAAQTAPRTLSWQGSQNGVDTTLTLRFDGARVAGSIDEAGTSLPVSGTLQGRTVQGNILNPQSGQPVIGLSALIAGDDLTLSLRPAGSAQAMRFAMRRVGAPAQAAATAGTAATASAPPQAAGGTGAADGGRVDPAFVGRWVSESQLNSPGGAGGFASLSTVRTLELTPDGRVRQSVRSAGGGGNWSYDGGGRVEFSGRWQVRGGTEFWAQPDGQAAFVRVGVIRRAGDYLVTESSEGRVHWRR